MNARWLLLASLCLAPLTACDRGEEADESHDKANSGSDAVETSASFSSDKVDGDGFSVAKAVAEARDMKMGSKQYKSIIVTLADYESTGKWVHNPKEGQRRVIINFAARSDILAILEEFFIVLTKNIIVTADPIGLCRHSGF